MAPSFKMPEQLKSLWGRFTPKQRAVIFVFAGATLAVVALFVYMLNRQEYATLFSGLTMEDSAAIVAKLKEQKIDHRLAQDGSTIEVSADQVADIRLQVVTMGLPQSGGTGFEIFDRNTFGITDFTQKINLRRALEGELSRTVARMKEVKSARVHLVIPEEKLFKEDQEKSKASVVLTLKPGKSLSRDQVLGISRLVASGVPGLVPEAVSVLDETGKLISQTDSGDGLKNMTEAQMEYRQSLEKEYERALMGILEPALGPGKARVQVSLSLNLDRVEQTSETYDPAKTAVTQSSKMEEIVPGSQMVGGIAGTRSNIPAQPVAAGQPAQPATLTTAQGADQRLRNQENLTYQPSRVLRREVFNVGEIRKATVAVVVDNKEKRTKDAKGKEQVQSVPWTGGELKDLEGVIVASIGIDDKRGDVVKVLNIPFLQEGEEAPPTLWERLAPILPTFVKYFGIILLFLLIYFFLLRPMKKRVVRILDVSMPHPVHAALAGIPGQAVAALPPGSPMALAGAPQAAVLPPAEEDLERELEMERESIARDLERKMVRSQNVKASQIQSLIKGEAKKNPEKIANILRGWLQD